MYYPPDLAILRVRSSVAFLTPYTVLLSSTGFGLLSRRAKSGWRPPPPTRAPAKTLRFFGSQSLLRFIAELMDSKPERRNSWVKKRCSSGDADKCWRCLQKGNIGCCRKKPAPCRKQGCLVCSAKEGCGDAVARAAAAQWQSSRSRRSTQKEAAAGSGSGEKKPKHATNAARKEAQKNRKIRRARYLKDRQEEHQGTCHRSLVCPSIVV